MNRWTDDEGKEEKARTGAAMYVCMYVCMCTRAHHHGVIMGIWVFGYGPWGVCMYLSFYGMYVSLYVCMYVCMYHCVYVYGSCLSTTKS